MSYLRSFFGGGSGADRRHEEGGGADIVERLVDRVQTSTTFEDRRDALKALRSLAKKYRLEVGSMCFPALVGILENDRNHSELLSMALDTLAVVITESDETDGEDDVDELGEKFAQIFIKDKRPVSLVLTLLDSYEFSIRRPIIQLLTGLLRHRASEVQNILMQDPMAINRLLDLLQESREVLRNDAVLMLSELTRGNPQIQKLVAYENAFQLLFDVIGHESADSIVIEDCLFVILSLLRKNPSNQQLFREASQIQRLAFLLNSLLNPAVEDEEGAHNGTNGVDEEWSKQKTANVIFVFQVIRSLVSHDNPVACTQAAQKIMHQCEILQNLCAVLLSEMGVSVEVLTEAIIAVAEVVRGNQKNQDYLASMSLVNPHDPQPRSAILVLLQSMTAEKQPFKLRCAVLYCFQAFVYHNEFGKTKVIETLLPASADAGQAMTAGHYLCSALISSEPVQVWYGCVAIMHCILDAQHLKEQLLRVQLATSLGEAPMSLLQQTCALLASLGNRRPQTRAGLLMLLAVWLHDCPVAITHFLHKDDNIQYLTSHIDEGSGEGSESENQVVKGLCAFVLAICLQSNDDTVEKNNRTSLAQVIERRVGRDLIAERLEGVSRSEQYVRAAQRPQPTAKIPPELLLDYEFTKVFKALEGDLVRLLRPAGGKGANGTAPSAQHEAIVTSYKDLIKRQDDQISSLMQQVRRLQTDLEQERAAGEQFKAQATPTDAVDQLRAELAEKCRLLDARTQADSTESAQSTARLQHDLQQMTVVAQQWQAEATRFQQFAEQWQQYQIAQLPNPVDVVVTTLQSQQQQLEQQLSFGYQAYEQQSQQLGALTSEKAAVDAELAATKQQLEQMRAQWTAEMQRQANQPPPQPAPVASNNEEVAALKKEQEDLLVLLADQDSKLREYRRRLVVFGDSVSDEDDESADEDSRA